MKKLLVLFSMVMMAGVFGMENQQDNDLKKFSEQYPEKKSDIKEKYLKQKQKLQENAGAFKKIEKDLDKNLESNNEKLKENNKVLDDTGKDMVVKMQRKGEDISKKIDETKNRIDEHMGKTKAVVQKNLVLFSEKLAYNTKLAFESLLQSRHLNSELPKIPTFKPDGGIGNIDILLDYVAALSGTAMEMANKLVTTFTEASVKEREGADSLIFDIKTATFKAFNDIEREFVYDAADNIEKVIN